MHAQKLLRSRQQQVAAQGETGTNSKRPSQYPEGSPWFFVKGQSCYLWDVDGNKYVDYVSALGANILGYSHPKVNEAMKAQIDRGVIFSMASPLEVEVQEKITELVPHMERVRFLKTGSEACQAALTIARAATGLLSVESNGYHGWHPEFTSLTEPALGVAKHPHIFKDAGAHLICEPVHLELTEERKHALASHMSVKEGLVIFDEVITGFRIPKYTVAKYWNLKPDITVLGKAIANGMSLAVVGGRAEVMDSCQYFVSSTYSGNLVDLAAANATIAEIKKNDLNELLLYSQRFLNGLNMLLADIDVKIEGYGTRGMLPIEEENCALFIQEMCKAGIFMGKAYFYTFAHLEEGIDEWVLNIAADVVRRIKAGSVKLTGPIPRPTFKR